MEICMKYCSQNEGKLHGDRVLVDLRKFPHPALRILLTSWDQVVKSRDSSLSPALR